MATRLGGRGARRGAVIPTPAALGTMARMSDPEETSTTPWRPWVRVVALVLVVGLLGMYVVSFF